jgi:asparagine synthetase B (glutamine-hydrolysing)
MRDTMVHRGPDGEGLWVAPGREVGLGFRRLAIIDLSADAHQPMTNEDASLQVVFTGEIYNHLSLRRELLAKGLGEELARNLEPPSAGRIDPALARDPGGRRPR